MAVNLNKDFYRKSEKMIEITPEHLLREEDTIPTKMVEITPIHTVDEQETINEKVKITKVAREQTPVHIRKEETSLEKANKAIEKAVEKEEQTYIKPMIFAVMAVGFIVLLVVGVCNLSDTFMQDVSTASSDAFSIMGDFLDYILNSPLFVLFLGITCLTLGIRAISKLMNLR